MGQGILNKPLRTGYIHLLIFFKKIRILSEHSPHSLGVDNKNNFCKTINFGKNKHHSNKVNFSFVKFYFTQKEHLKF